VTQNAGVAAGSRWTDLVSLGVLASSVPRDVIDDAVVAAGRQARRSDGKLPPHVMVYFAMAMALFAEDDYEEVAARLAGTLGSWGCWDARWGPPTSGGITKARERLGVEPLAGIFAQVAVPVADQLTRGAFVGPWRLMSIDGFEWDVPDTPGNAAAFGYPAGGRERPAFPKVRVVTISECGSHAVVDVATGPVAGKGSGEQSLARGLYGRLEPEWLLIADRNFYNWQDWCAASASGAALLWRVKADLALPVLDLLPDGSYSSVLINPRASSAARQRLTEAARAGEDLDENSARYVRVIEYQVPDRDETGELIALITTITEMTAAPAPLLAQAYHERWVRHEALCNRVGVRDPHCQPVAAG
jgi:transposase IS4-like protein